MKQTVTIRLEPDTVTRLNKKAADAKRTLSDYLRLLIEDAE